MRATSNADMPMNVNAELELAYTYLARARDYAQLFGYSQKMLDRIDLLKKAVAKTRSDIAERKQA
jgi:hypothetical protein